MSTLIINFEGNDFKLTSFFDCDMGEGLTVRDNNTNKIVGEMWGISIPSQEEVEEDPDEYEHEIKRIKSYLESWLLSVEYFY